MKKTLLALAVVAGAMFAQADSYLYWMLETAPSAGSSSYNPSPMYNDYAVRVYDGTKYLTFGNSSETYAAAETGGQYSNLIQGDPASTSFIIELWNESGSEAAYRTGSINMADYIKSSSEHAIAGISISAGQFNNVPEPTSGMMMLLGAMLLGLKRKKLA